MLFRDAGTSRLCVLYRRPDGPWGFSSPRPDEVPWRASPDERRRAPGESGRRGGASSRPAVPVRDLLRKEARVPGAPPARGQGRAWATRSCSSRVQRPGLALTGYTDYIRYGRVQIMGGSEISYLQKLRSRPARGHPRAPVPLPISCFVVTKGLAPAPELLRAAERRGIPVLTTPVESTAFIKQLSSFLETRLALRVHLHAVLMDVFGLGVLIMGESGIGKSECALDLMDRGHRLVADDVVEIKRMTEALVGDSPDLTRYHMEIRGLGVLNIKDLYGVSAIRTSKRVELVVQLERWEPAKEYDRLGLRDESFPSWGWPCPSSACRWRPAATSRSWWRWRRATSS